MTTTTTPTTRWTAPPSWPQPSPGWVPPAGWQPKASWGPAPEGWLFWQPDYAAAPVTAKQGNWFGRHKVLTGLAGVVALIIIMSAAGGGGNKATTATTDPLTAPKAPAAAPHKPPVATKPLPAAKPVAPSKPNDKGWVVQSLNTKNDGLGDWGGTARITNTNGSSMTGTFTFTLARAGSQLTTLQGSAQDVAAGETVTIDLINTDKYSAGAFTYDFQTDVSF